MMKKSPNNPPPDSLPWAVVLTWLVLALISAWLVFSRNWEPWQALLVVSLVALAIVLVMVIALLIWTAPEGRAEFWRVAWQTCRNDIDLILKFFRIRR